ncbi:hypothetical protein BDQ17DRAFT_1418616 [Cyathus striatus]|nr:hypothetical protein BDQ17DRAFT_1418616 [Cyathus striatus]
MPSNPPSLPSLLPSHPALHDPLTTLEQFQQAEKLAKVTSPEQQVARSALVLDDNDCVYCRTPIYICGLKDCNRLFPSRERLMTHRKREHSSESESEMISWNGE